VFSMQRFLAKVWAAQRRNFGSATSEGGAMALDPRPRVILKFSSRRKLLPTPKKTEPIKFQGRSSPARASLPDYPTAEHI
jgi:hypothetical protein